MVFRERQIKEIEASFEACKTRPVHASNKDLYPVEVLPLLPDFDRYGFLMLLHTFLFSKCDAVSHPTHKTFQSMSIDWKGMEQQIVVSSFISVYA